MGQGKGDGNPNAIKEHGFQEGVRNRPKGTLEAPRVPVNTVEALEGLVS
jgi:hypothetical protein